MPYSEFTLASPDDLNARLTTRFLALSAAGRVRRSHFFAGRFENIYIERDDIPEIGPVLDNLLERAARWLQRPVAQLQAGFWFNAMEAGHCTAPHHHDENDELLSAVYYVRVPVHSGELILYEGEQRIRVQPCAGKLVMFAPAVMHEVSPHRGEGLRLSIGMNVGPVDDE